MNLLAEETVDWRAELSLKDSIDMLCLVVKGIPPPVVENFSTPCMQTHVAHIKCTKELQEALVNALLANCYNFSVNGDGTLDYWRQTMWYDVLTRIEGRCTVEVLRETRGGLQVKFTDTKTMVPPK